MGPFDRSLLAIYALAVSAGIVVGIFVLTGVLAPTQLETFLRPEHNALATGVLGVFLLAGLRLLGVSLRRKKESQAIVDESALGQVRVSLTALENLIDKIVSPVPGIREVRPKVGPENGGIGIRLKVVASPDINVPETSRAIQQLVQDQIREVTGLTVNRIKIEVENFAVSKGRVE
ncbi:MAG: alkaline shock response membrane anchor protein AmaP [Bacillota bacterium]